MKKDTGSNRPKYKSILKKYIRYVFECEGSDYITIHDHRKMCEIEFKGEEWDVLKELAKKK